MGARNSAAHFQKVMSGVMQGLLMLSALIYIDDILVYSKTEEGLVSAIKQVLMRLDKFGIKLKPAKCDLFCVALVWCGHHICSNGIGVDPRYTEAVMNMLKPTTAADLQQFWDPLPGAPWGLSYIY